MKKRSRPARVARDANSSRPSGPVPKGERRPKSMAPPKGEVQGRVRSKGGIEPKGARRAPGRRSLAWLLLIPVAAILGGIVAYLLFTRWYVMDTSYQQIDFEVSAVNSIGFNLDRDAIHFGKLPPGGGGSRQGTVSSKEPAIARLDFDEDLKEWVTANPSCVELDAGEAKSVQLIALVPKNATMGNHSGNMRVVFTRRTPWSKCPA